MVVLTAILKAKPPGKEIELENSPWKAYSKVEQEFGTICACSAPFKKEAGVFLWTYADKAALFTLRQHLT